MRQQVSSTHTPSSTVGDNGSYDGGDTSIYDMEDLEFFRDLFAKGWNHLTNCVVNEIQ